MVLPNRRVENVKAEYVKLSHSHMKLHDTFFHRFEEVKKLKLSMNNEINLGLTGIIDSKLYFFVLCDVYYELIIGVKYHTYFEVELGRVNLLHYLPLDTVHNDDTN